MGHNYMGSNTYGCRDGGGRPSAARRGACAGTCETFNAVMAYIDMAYIVMAYVVMVYIVMAYIVMAYTVWPIQLWRTEAWPM